MIFPRARDAPPWWTVLLVCTLAGAGLSCNRQEAGPLPADMILIPAGPFTMGLDDPRAVDEYPARQVYLKAYYIDRCEVTNARFREFVEATGYLSAAEQEGQPEREDRIDWRHPEGPEWDISTRLDHPVVYVNWDDARAYCEWQEKRLPTEAEWEKSARGSDARTWPWGNTFDARRANMWGDADGYEKTAPVGSFPAGASPGGALDMAGNVWEWCADWYARDYYASGAEKNPPGPEEGRYKVLRGGSWINPGATLRITNRFKILPADRSLYVGFRCARSK